MVGTLTLADVTNERGIHLTIYATGCIFHYDKDFPQDSGIGFKESDTPNFVGSYYSRTKVQPAAPAPACARRPPGLLCSCCGSVYARGHCCCAHFRVLMLATADFS